MDSFFYVLCNILQPHSHKEVSTTHHALNPHGLNLRADQLWVSMKYNRLSYTQERKEEL